MNKYYKKIITFFFVIFFLSGCISTAIYGERHKSDELHFVTLPSGWKLALYRYFPEKRFEKNFPVLVCHGISSNKWMLDLEPEHSIAYYLKEKGFEVWMVNLRGTDLGTKPSFFNSDKYNYTFDDYVSEDVPSVIDYVLTQTGKSSVHWVGHSMGGMIVYAYAGTYGDEKFRSLTFIGSPVKFDIPGKLFNLAKKHIQLVDSLNFIPTRAGSLLIAPFGRIPLDAFESTIWNKENLPPKLRKKILTLSVENIAGGVMRQFEKFIRTGKFESMDGKRDYLEGLRNIRKPSLFITGILDNLASPHNVFPAYEKISSDNKIFFVLSTGNGYLADYGHVDLAIGDNAIKDTYSIIGDFLDQND